MTEVNLDRFYKFIKLKKLNEAENEISRLLSKNNPQAKWQAVNI